jgi:hypothetical protein
MEVSEGRSNRYGISITFFDPRSGLGLGLGLGFSLFSFGMAETETLCQDLGKRTVVMSWWVYAFWWMDGCDKMPCPAVIFIMAHADK